MHIKQSTKWFMLLPVSLFLFIFVLAGCSNNETETASDSPELSGTINIAGSTSVQPLVELMAHSFMDEHPKVKVNVSGGGSSAGVRSCAAGTVDIGAASRDIKMTEADLVPYAIARDAVAIVVNSSNSISDLTTEQVAKIYAGEITNWKEVGGKDENIIVVSREEGSGTRDCFHSKVTKAYGKEIKADALFYDSNGAVRTKVSAEPKAIGYLSLGYAEGLKTITVDGVECTLENCKSGKYPVLRRLNLLTKNAPSGKVREFLNFCRSEEGRQIAAEEGYIPVSK